MAYIFRLHPNGANINSDWQSCQPYGTNVISQIVAPNGATAKTEITSIPTPFARIALVKNAFAEVVRSGNLEGTTIYHKMVSDSLDIAEIFFNYDKLKNLFVIKVWDAQTDLNALQSSHPQMYDTLEIFLKQDASVYNFNKMQRLYILEYIGPDIPEYIGSDNDRQQRFTEMNIVGATSPASLFFSPANDMSHISKHVSFGQDHPFDGNYQPLYRRDPKFVEYLFTFRHNCGQTNFAQLFPEVDAYLTAVFSKLPNALQNTVRNLNDNAIANYQLLQFDNANSVDILGFPYHKKPNQHIGTSDFTIAYSHYNGNPLPLILPIEPGTLYANMFYVTDRWGRDNAAPYSDNTPWMQRVLPFDGTPHPYLTIDDFLEDTILYSPCKANAEQFFFGNWNDTDNSCFMLPLKPLFFELFTVAQLVNGINGSPMIKALKINAGDISIELSIPVAGNRSITYTRNYYQNATPDANRNRGAIKILSNSFGLAMLPMAKNEHPFQRIAITHDFDDPYQYRLECFSNGQKIIDTQEVTRNRTENNLPQTQIFTNDSNKLDYLRIGMGNNYGVVIPLLKNVQRNKTYTFAVDFGTTNTHVEYTDGAISSTPFADKQLALCADYIEAVKQALEVDLLPIAVGEKFRFPSRTVLSEASTTDWQQLVLPLAQTNIPLTYGHRPTFDYNAITTDLKWSNDLINIRRVESYIENLMLMMRNKVLIDGGRLADTKIIWFYPGSMTIARRNAYQTVWQTAYRKYFGDDVGNICSTLESVAPYEFFRRQTPAASRMVSIDIGGGTTDVVFAENGNIRYTTSFRFAANSIFGDGYTDNGPLNGLILQYRDQISNLLSSNGLYELREVFDNLCKTGKSAELASFFFSMKNDDNVIEKDIANLLDWNVMLQQNDEYKVVFLLFYTAIIYHVAHIMHAKNMEFPRHIAFSGNGARVVSVLSPNLQTLAEYTKNVFCRVYGQAKYHPDGLDIILSDNPKTATCKGGLNIMQSQNTGMSTGEKLVLKELSSRTFFKPADTYSSIDDRTKSATVTDVRSFIRFTFDNDSGFSLRQNFGIEVASQNNAKNICQMDLETFFDNGMELKREENDRTDPVEEPLFFYPIIGMLHKLCNSIYTNFHK